MMKNFIRVALMVLLVSSICSCGLNNTMYNAKRYFVSAQARPLNSNGRPTPQAIEEYTKTIQKCGIIISQRKENKETEEAVFLMAKALYFKGNSAFQAKDQFENLIRLFPDSRHLPEANIFLARIYREINQPAEAESRLEAFVRNPSFRNQHPRALLVLADFEIQDKDYLRAEYWLQRVVSEYGNTREAKEAFFLIGKNYYLQKEYTRSLAQFQRLLRAWRLDRTLRMDTLFFLALNQLEIQDYSGGLESVNLIVKKESRLDKLALTKVLRARLLLASGRQEQGQQELEAVIRDYPRSPASAEATYWLAENHFYNRGDRTAALASYNRVRTESPNSIYVTQAATKVTAIQQFNQNTNLNVETNLQQFLDYHYLAADNYYKQFNLPDSSFALYNTVISYRDTLLARREAVVTEIAAIDLRIDSLRLQKYAIVDSSESSRDTLELNRRISGWNTDRQTKENRSNSLSALLERFDTDIIPFVWFVQASLRMKMGQKDPEVANILLSMQVRYPENKYTNAIRMLYNGQRVRVVDPRVEAAEARYDFALGLYSSAPDSMVAILQELLEGSSEELKMQSEFRLGWHFAVEQEDTLQARPYLESLLRTSNTGRYGELARRIFDGRNFLLQYQTNTVVNDSSEIVLPDTLLLQEDVEADSVWTLEMPVFEQVNPLPEPMIETTEQDIVPSPLDLPQRDPEPVPVQEEFVPQ